MAINPDIKEYNLKLDKSNQEICILLQNTFNKVLKTSESKIWYAHPVWFIKDNPIVGYTKLKNCIQVLFWSGQDFDEPCLKKSGSFKAAEIRYTTIEDVNVEDLTKCLQKSILIQYDYKNIVKNKGKISLLNLD